MADGEQPLGVQTALPLCLHEPRSEPPAQPPLWPPAAQWFTAALLGGVIAVLAWRGYGLTRPGTRPLDLDTLPVVDINRAGPEEIELLPGIGPGLAKRIVAERERHGPFRSLEDLRRVPGIGPARLERIEHLINVPDGPAAPPPPRVIRAARPDGKPAGKKAPAEPIDINQASAQELQRLPGIGPTLSARIVETRTSRPFASVEELRRVKGIGAKTLERLRPHVRVQPSEK